MDCFKNKIYIVTGSTQGIGKSLADRLCFLGAKVVINSRRTEKVELTVQEFESRGYDVLGVPGDITDFEVCTSMREAVIAKYGKIDFLINNAGITSRAPMDATIPEVYKTLFDTNVLGSLYPTIAVIDELKKTKGGLLFITSLAGIVGLPNCSAYSSTKRAIVSLAESFKIELHDHEVYVGLNYPGYTENDSAKQTLNGDGTIETLKKREGFTVEPVEKVINSIIMQIKKRRFRSFSSFNGRLVLTMYRIFPSMSIFLVRRDKKKYMDMQ